MTQQSPSWEKFQHSAGFIEAGFPFNEGFPLSYVNVVYEIICRDGSRHNAQVDASNQYSADGLRWKTQAGESFIPEVVVAWRELNN